MVGYAEVIVEHSSSRQQIISSVRKPRSRHLGNVLSTNPAKLRALRMIL
jgi:hypothetical protein